jgi:hypothetical protein
VGARIVFVQTMSSESNQINKKHMSKQQIANFKYNGGQGALLCSGCRVIIKTGKDFTDQEKKAIKGEVTLPLQYCKNCFTPRALTRALCSYTIQRTCLGAAT